LPTTQDVLKSSCIPGNVITQDSCGNLVGCGTNIGASSCGNSNGCASDISSFCHLTSGSYPGSTESHLHIDRCGNIFCHSHPGGDISHNHDSDRQDVYVGQVTDCRSLTRNPDSLNRDELGATTACGSDVDCPGGSVCINGMCELGQSCITDANCKAGMKCSDGICRKSIIDQSRSAGACDPGFGAGCAKSLTSTNGSSDLFNCGRIGGVRPYTGNLVGGFRNPPGCNNINCSSCRFTSASLCDGSTLSHCNLACAAPGNCNTLPPQSLNARAKAPDLRGFQNDGISCVTGSLCGSKRPTVCKTKIKEVFYC